MQKIKFTLIADGSSDKTLLRIIKWLLDDLYPEISNDGEFADFRYLPDPPKTLKSKLVQAKYYFPYNILFIHRDAETINVKTIQERQQQIKEEIGEDEFAKVVCIIPVKMMETWLMIDTEAIKKASGNRNYSGPIVLPPVNKLEKESQPKKKLHGLLEQASGLKGRNLQKFNAHKAVHLVAENIKEFNTLRQLEAFRAFELNLTTVVNAYLQN